MTRDELKDLINEIVAIQTMEQNYNKLEESAKEYTSSLSTIEEGATYDSIKLYLSNVKDIKAAIKSAKKNIKAKNNSEAKKDLAQAKKLTKTLISDIKKIPDTTMSNICGVLVSVGFILAKISVPLILLKVADNYGDKYSETAQKTMFDSLYAAVNGSTDSNTVQQIKNSGKEAAKYLVKSKVAAFSACISAFAMMISELNRLDNFNKSDEKANSTNMQKNLIIQSLGNFIRIIDQLEKTID